MNTSNRIFIAGHNGMVGAALLRKLKNQGYYNFVLRSSAELDLRNQAAVMKLFETEKPEFVFLAAAKVGGIYANDTCRAEFIYDNIQIQANIIHASYQFNVTKLLFLGSSCIYPKYAPQPIPENALLSGELEPTNEAYAIAKIAGIKMCQAYHHQYGCNFISVMPTNLYGPNDNYDLQQSHVLPALVRKILEAKMKHWNTVEIWGTGTPRREFLHVDDLADACHFLMLHYDNPEIINVGTGKDIQILNLAKLIKDCTQYQGEFYFNINRPNGTPRKLLDTTRLNALGWFPKISLPDGVKSICDNYEEEMRNRMLVEV